jgi:hypothetical protein
MSPPQERDFDDDPATTVMPDDVVAELSARSRDDAAEPLSDEPTKVASISVAELFAAAASVDLVDARPASARTLGGRFPWRRAAIFVLAAALVAMLAILIGPSLSVRN